MIRIEISDESVKTKPVSKAGRTFQFHEQAAWAWMVGADGRPDQHPTKIVVTIEDPSKPYAKGMYTLLPGSLYVGAFNALMVGRLKLGPVSGQVSKVA